MQPYSENPTYLERCQNRALRMITGKLKTTPLQALRIEVGAPSIATQLNGYSITGQIGANVITAVVRHCTQVKDNAANDLFV